jgi:hypothetical protein
MVGLVGYGKLGRILAEDLRQQDRVATFDIKLRRIAFWRRSSADVWLARLQTSTLLP